MFRSACVIAFVVLSALVLVPLSSAGTQPPLFPVQTTVSLQPIAGCNSCTLAEPAFGNTGFAAGDFNGDGLPDLIAGGEVPLSNGQTPLSFYLLAVLARSGAPPLISATPIGSCQPAQILAADINRDKKLDAVVSCVSGSVEVLLGNGDGTFQSPVPSTLPATANVGAIAVADFNGDGLLDLAVLTQAGYAVQLNTGGAQFGTATAYTLSSQLSGGHIASGDFNGDGKADLVVGGLMAGYLLGNGDGTFGSVQSLPAHIQAFVVADFNHDGISDLAYAGAVIGTHASDTSNLVVLLGGASGLATSGSSVGMDGSFSGNLLPAVLTESGNLDLVAINSGLSTALANTLVFRGDGKGGLSVPSSYAVAGTAAVADMNGDGHPDLVGNLSSALSVAAGVGDGTFIALPDTPADNFLQPPAFADMNGDGLMDALTYDDHGAPAVYLANGDGRFTPVINPALDGTPATQLAGGLIDGITLAADFNGDGKPDFANIAPGASDANSGPVFGSLAVFPGNGDGTLTGGSITGLGVEPVRAAVAGDFNLDKKNDVIVIWADQTTETGGALFVAGKGDGTFATPVAIPLLTNAPSLLATADLNGDGKLDLIVGGGGTVATYLGGGDGTFLPGPQGLQVSVEALAVADVTGDGNPDLVAVTGTSLSIYAGDGSGGFAADPVYTAAIPTPGVFAPSSVMTGDLNGDGLPDIAVLIAAQPNSSLVVYLNQASATFAQDPNIYFAGTNPFPFSAGPLGFGRLNVNSMSNGATQTLDAAVYANGGITSLLNQSNAAPKPVPAIMLSLPNATAGAPIDPSQLVTINAQLSTAGSIAPTGTVSFFANNALLLSNTVTNGAASVVVRIPGPGEASLTARYSGDSNYGAGRSAPFLVNVAGATSITITSSANASYVGESVNFTIAVTGSSPTGTVALTNGAAVLGTIPLANGQAIYSTAFTALGTQTINAVYSGDGHNAPSTASFVQMVVSAINLQPGAGSSTALTVAAGSSVTSAISVSGGGGFEGSVAFSCTGLPQEASCSFAPATVSLSGPNVGTTTLTLNTAGSGTASLKKNRTLPFTLGGGAIAVCGLLLFFPVRRRYRYVSLVTFAASVIALTSTGCGSGGNAGMTVPHTPAGSYPFSVVAVSGSQQTTSAYTLTVQ